MGGNTTTCRRLLACIMGEPEDGVIRLAVTDQPSVRYQPLGNCQPPSVECEPPSMVTGSDPEHTVFNRENEGGEHVAP